VLARPFINPRGFIREICAQHASRSAGVLAQYDIPLMLAAKCVKNVKSFVIAARDNMELDWSMDLLYLQALPRRARINLLAAGQLVRVSPNPDEQYRVSVVEELTNAREYCHHSRISRAQIMLAAKNCESHKYDTLMS